MRLIELVETMKTRTPLIVKPMNAKKQRFCHLAREWYLSFYRDPTRGFARYRDYEVVSLTTEGNAIMAEIVKGDKND